MGRLSDQFMLAVARGNSRHFAIRTSHSTIMFALIFYLVYVFFYGPDVLRRILLLNRKREIKYKLAGTYLRQCKVTVSCENIPGILEMVIDNV